MKRLCIGILLLLSACTAPQPKVAGPPEPTELQQFGQALDLLTREHNPRGLKDFQERYPASPWSWRAETILLYVQELNQRKEQLTEARAGQQAAEQAGENLREENRQLTTKIDQLKQLLIELEQRPQ